jgi:hypothetical protein
MTVAELVRRLNLLPPTDEVVLADTYYTGGGDEPENLEEPELLAGNGYVVLHCSSTRYIAENATKGSEDDRPI